MGEWIDERVWQTIYLGPLPTEKIRHCLGIELAPAEVVFWAHGQKHAFKEKPDREPICSPQQSHGRRPIAHWPAATP